MSEENETESADDKTKLDLVMGGRVVMLSKSDIVTHFSKQVKLSKTNIEKMIEENDGCVAWKCRSWKLTEKIVYAVAMYKDVEFDGIGCWEFSNFDIILKLGQSAIWRNIVGEMEKKKKQPSIVRIQGRDKKMRLALRLAGFKGDVRKDGVLIVRREP